MLRSLAAITGGLLRETAEIALPAFIRKSTTYETMVGVALRFLIEEAGEVKAEGASAERLTENFLLKRTASHGIELLGILAFRASPIWVLAALADASGGGRRLISEIVQELQSEGLLSAEGRFENVDQILSGLEATSKHLAHSLNLPPMHVRELQAEWDRLKQEAASIPPRDLPTTERLERVWADLKNAAAEQKRSVFSVSTLLALSALAHVPSRLVWLTKAMRSAVRRTGRITGDALLNHYGQAIGEIRSEGFVRYWGREFRPYLIAAAVQFAPEKQTLTDRLFRRARK